jgi:hypothetical protein
MSGYDRHFMFDGFTAEEDSSIQFHDYLRLLQSTIIYEIGPKMNKTGVKLAYCKLL